MSYYTAITWIVWLTMGVLCILTFENDRLTGRDKAMFYLSYVLVALSSLAEWLSVCLADDSGVPLWSIMAAKCADYMLTPAAGAVFALQLRSRSLWNRLLIVTIVANALFQVLSLPFGWMDVHLGHNHFEHGPLYGVYMGIYLLILALVLVEFVTYGRRFRRQNTVSLYATLLMVVIAIAMQELSDEAVHCVYLAIAIGMALMFIHYMEFSQLAADDQIMEQDIEIATDPLTGVSNRRAYLTRAEELEGAGPLPADLVVFSIDIDDLKGTNDSLGHEAGDELISGAAECIVHALGEQGICYRVGGDEFVVLAQMSGTDLAAMRQRLLTEVSRWHGQRVGSLHLSVGVARAREAPTLGLEELLQRADERMYREKEAYYRDTGRDRRRARQRLQEKA